MRAKDLELKRNFRQTQHGIREQKIRKGASTFIDLELTIATRERWGRSSSSCSFPLSLTTLITRK